MKATLTKAEYLQLVGLLTLAERHIRFLKELRDAVREITGEEDEDGHSSDAVHCGYSADELLGKLGIAIEGG